MQLLIIIIYGLNYLRLGIKLSKSIIIDNETLYPTQEDKLKSLI